MRNGSQEKCRAVPTVDLVLEWKSCNKLTLGSFYPSLPLSSVSLSLCPYGAWTHWRKMYLIQTHNCLITSDEWSIHMLTLTESPSFCRKKECVDFLKRQYGAAIHIQIWAKPQKYWGKWVSPRQAIGAEASGPGNKRSKCYHSDFQTFFCKWWLPQFNKALFHKVAWCELEFSQNSNMIRHSSLRS